MNPVITFEGFEVNHINKERLERTVRLVPVDPSKSASFGDLLNSLEAAGVTPDEILGIYKVSAIDHSYSVLLMYEDTVEKLV